MTATLLPNPASTGELPTGVTVVTPTRRLAHHLRARHHTACLARGASVWRTPDVVTWPEFVRRQFETDRAAGRTSLRWLPVSLGRLAWERIVAGDVARWNVLASAGLGAVAQRSWALLHQYRIPYDALEAGAGLESEAFARWVASYREWLQQGGWLDPALASAQVGPFPTDTPLAFVGFDRWTPEQAALLERLQASGVPLSIPEQLATDAPVRAQVVECNDFDDELEAAARWAALSLQRQPEARLALIVPELDRERDRARRALSRVLVPDSLLTGGPAPGSRAFELASARPLAEWPVVAAALAWLDACVRPADLASASSLLLGPYDGAAIAERHVRAELDVDLRRRGFFVPGMDRIAHAARKAGCVATAGRMDRAMRRASGWAGVRRPSEWAPEFAALLAGLGWPGDGADSAEHQAVQRWQALLGEFAAGDDVAGRLGAGAAVAHLRQLALEAAFEPQDTDAPLLVIDPETALGMQFDAIWICGLDAARWPAPASPDPFLPRDWQSRREVPGSTAELAEVSARRTLQRLSHAAPTVLCSVPQFADEAPLMPSALIAGLPRADTLPSWQGPDPTRALFDARPVLQRLADGSLPAFAEHAVVKGGTRLLELQAACPFRAAVELRLGGGALEDPVAGIAPTERGSLVHKALQAFWLDVRDQATLLALSPESRAERVTAVASAVLEPWRDVADEVRLELLELEQRWLEERIHELLDIDAQRQPFTVVHVEDPRIVDVGGVQVRVVLDRVDRLADGSYAFIDYKTGANTRPASWMGERPELPQLPLYVRTVDPDAVGAVAFGSVRKGSTRYAGYARDAGVFSDQLKPFVAGKAPFEEYGDWKGMLTAWERRLDALAREHARGDARLAPDPTRACRHCHLPGLCRTGQATDAGEEAVDVDAG
jgi:ATP-dependent helicase/nuclease subunit B